MFFPQPWATTVLFLHNLYTVPVPVVGEVEYLQGGQALQVQPLHGLQPIITQIQGHETP